MLQEKAAKAHKKNDHNIQTCYYKAHNPVIVLQKVHKTPHT